MDDRIVYMQTYDKRLVYYNSNNDRKSAIKNAFRYIKIFYLGNAIPKICFLCGDLRHCVITMRY
jgi:hypothetical protein